MLHAKINALDIMLYNCAILRGELHEVLFQPGGIIVVSEYSAIRGEETDAIFHRDKFSRHGAEFFPKPVQPESGVAAKEMVDASVKRIAFPIPCGDCPPGTLCISKISVLKPFNWP
jgi:hypothetical protein